LQIVNKDGSTISSAQLGIIGVHTSQNATISGILVTVDVGYPPTAVLGYPRLLGD